jgi:uncharacterized protein YebE (UPF0316 family)
MGEMISKLLIIFFAGIIETWLFTGWSLKVNEHKAFISSVLMVSYMIAYLKIIDIALKDANTLLMIISYALSCGIGNYIRVRYEKKK